MGPAHYFLHRVSCFAVCLQMHPVSAPADKYPEDVHDSTVVPKQAAPKAAVQPKVLQGTIPSGHIPKPVILPDYIA